MDHPVNYDDDDDGDQPLVLSNKNDSKASSKSQNSVALQSGLDISDERSQEVLRDEEASLGDESLSPIFHRRKITGSFKLTPRLDEPPKRAEEKSIKAPLVSKTPTVSRTNTMACCHQPDYDVVALDLVTPQQNVTLNHGTGCPERPLKGHRHSLGPLSERSCRHLFTEELSLPVRNEEEEVLSDKESDEDIALKCSKGREKSAFCLKNPEKDAERQNICNNEDIESEKWSTTPDGDQCDPTLSCSPSSVCTNSDCCITSCSSDQPEMSSPNLSEIKITKRTLESSSGENDDLKVEEAIIDPPQLESSEEDVPVEDVDSDSKYFIPASQLPKPQIISGATDLAKNTPMSSIGSGPSNWTVVSGVSPLPLSDPSQLRRHNHHHRHHHHHHHHHHRHQNVSKEPQGSGNEHHSSSSTKKQHSLSRSKVVFTSTPIRQCDGHSNLDVSAITGLKRTDGSLDNQEVSRFVITEELNFSDPIVSDTDASRGNDLDGWTDFSPGEPVKASSPCKPAVASLSCEPDNVPTQRRPKIAHPYREPRTVVSPSQEKTGEGIKVNFEQKLLDHFGKRKVKKDHKCPSKRYKLPHESQLIGSFTNMNKDAGNTPFVRRITKQEAHVLYTTPDNMSDDIWSKLPSPRRCTSLDETLGRVASPCSPVSSSLQ